jgi:hypothetical protein
MNRSDISSVPPGPPDVADRALDAALAAFRDDCRSARPSARLAESVLAAVARGDDETSRFHRIARTYAAAAAVLALVGVAGSVLAHRDVKPATARMDSTLDDLADARLSNEVLVSVADLSVGGRHR